MKFSSLGFLLPAIGVLVVGLSGCATSTQTYANQHPELSVEQRKIFELGKIPNGEVVAGLTREQVRLVMGRDPTQFTKANGQDVWVWVKEQMPTFGRPVEQMGAERGGVGRDAGGSGVGQDSLAAAADSSSPTKTVPVRTAVYFQGNLATRAEVSEGRL